MKHKHKFRTDIEESVASKEEEHNAKVIHLRYYDKVYSDGKVIHCLTKEQSPDLRK